jgi:translocator protein
MTSTRKWLGLAIWIAIVFSAAWFGSHFTDSEWYQQLQQPAWAPPGWVFAPVWTLLYLLMAIAAWLVWTSYGWAGARFALTVFLVQLVLNALWSWIFFGLRQPGFALIEIVALWVLIAVTLVAFSRKRPLSGALLLPYLAWVSFAAALNFSLWMLNR